MNADLQGMWDYYFSEKSRKRCNNIIVTDLGKSLSHEESRKLIRWGLYNGYKYLKEMPEFEEIFN